MGQSSKVVHTFKTDEEFSKSPEVQEFLNKFYLSAFPDMSRHEFITDPEQQKAGRDRVIYRIDHDNSYIDEKIRREYYPDFLIEYGHTDGKPGWVNKELDIDYIAYIWLERSEGYLLDWLDLVRVWHLCGEGWKKKYRTQAAKNNGYGTLSIPIPIYVLANLVKHIPVKVKA